MAKHVNHTGIIVGIVVGVLLLISLLSLGLVLNSVVQTQLFWQQIDFKGESNQAFGESSVEGYHGTTTSKNTVEAADALTLLLQINKCRNCEVAPKPTTSLQSTSLSIQPKDLDKLEIIGEFSTHITLNFAAVGSASAYLIDSEGNRQLLLKTEGERCFDLVLTPSTQDRWLARSSCGDRLVTLDEHETYELLFENSLAFEGGSTAEGYTETARTSISQINVILKGGQPSPSPTPGTGDDESPFNFSSLLKYLPFIAAGLLLAGLVVILIIRRKK